MTRSNPRAPTTLIPWKRSCRRVQAVAEIFAIDVSEFLERTAERLQV